MNGLLDLLAVISFLSLSANIALLVFIRKTKKTKTEVSYDAKALLRDLASGPALVKIEYVDRSDIFLRSPRHM